MPTQTGRRLSRRSLVCLSGIQASAPGERQNAVRLVLGLSGSESNGLLLGILVNDNDSTVFVVWQAVEGRNRIAVLASSLGHRCCSCASAEEFLEVFQPTRIGCVILDLHLPGMSGLELLEYVPGLYHPFPAILTGKDVDVRTAVRAMQAGAVTVLDKAWDNAQLVDAIDVALGISETVREAHGRRADLCARFDGLDAREREVVSMIVEGRPYKAIARELGVSHRTIDRICATVYQKTGTESAVDLARAVGELSRLRTNHRESYGERIPPQTSALRRQIGIRQRERSMFVDDPHCALAPRRG